MGKLNAFKIARIVALVAVWAAITFIAFRHQQLGERPGGAPTIHALCPFGGLATLHQTLAQGDYIKRIHPSAIILLGGTVLLALVFRRAFCGWICPLGAMQELLATIGRRARLRLALHHSRVDGLLRPVKIITLVLIIGLTWATGELVFNAYDPWAAYAHIGGGWAEIGGEYLVGAAILLLTLVGSLFVDRLWCRYLCPLGGLLALIGRIGAARVVRNDDTCIHCHLCDRACPVDIRVEAMQQVTTGECLTCGECVNVCPQPGALQFQAPRRVISPLMVGVLALAIFFGVVLVTKATGTWRSLPGSMDELVEHGGALSADNIRGFMTLNEIADAYRMVPADLAAELGLPADIDLDQPINAMMKAQGRDVEEIRAVVARHLGEPVAASQTPSAAPGAGAQPPSGAAAGPAAEAIQGTMTFEQIAAGFGISAETLISELSLPADTPRDKPISGIMKASDRSVGEVREAVGRLSAQD